jgi:hypothetical protein
MRFLKQSTATTLLLGPFLDETDGQTAETALTVSQADVLLWKQGGTTLAQKNESTSCTHRSNGLYTCPVDATDTNTLGTLVVSVDESGAAPIRQDYTVVAANVYDSLFGSGDVLDVSVTQWTGTNVATPDTAGYVKSTLKNGTGTGEVALTSGNVALTAAGNTAVVDALYASTAESNGSLTFKTMWRCLFAIVGGRVSISGSTVTFNTANNAKTRATVVTDSSNQRTTVTLDGTD